jgi:hypothetical protein
MGLHTSIGDLQCEGSHVKYPLRTIEGCLSAERRGIVDQDVVEDCNQKLLTCEASRGAT